MDSTTAVFALDDVLSRSARLVRRAQQLPPAGARPVTISGRVGGWIAPRALESIRALPGVEAAGGADTFPLGLSRSFTMASVVGASTAQKGIVVSSVTAGAMRWCSVAPRSHCSSHKLTHRCLRSTRRAF